MKTLLFFFAFTFIVNAQWMDKKYFGGGVGSKVFAVDLNGTDEYMSNASPVNMDLNDTNQVKLAIDNDFELGEIYVDDFTSDITNWTGINSDIEHYTVDNLGVGRVDVLKDSAAGTVSVYAQTIVGSSTFEIGKTYKITYRYYIPSSNTSLAGIELGLRNSQFLTEQTTLDAWTLVTETVLSIVNQDRIRIYGTDGVGNQTNITVDDVFYIDDVSISSFPSYTATGNHSFDSTSVNPLTGSYSGLIVSTGVGDVDSCVSLPNDNYTVPTEGLKYTAQMQIEPLFAAAGDSITIDVGTQSKTFLVDTTTIVFDFEAAAGDTLFKIYALQVDTIKFDEANIREGFDRTIQFWFNTSATSGTLFELNSTVGKLDAYLSTNDIYSQYNDGITTVTLNPSSTVNDDTWHHYLLELDRDGYMKSFIDNSLVDSVDISGQGFLVFDSLYIGHDGNAAFYEGLIGEFKDDRGLFTSTEKTAAYNRGLKGKHFLETGNEVGWWWFAGSNNTTFLSDKTGNNDLTGTNVTQSDDQVKLKKYAD